MATREVQLPVQEMGYVRYKLSASASFGSDLSGITLGGNSISEDQIGSLVTQPSPAAFASTLFDLAPHPRIVINSWATLDVVMDTDFCFFRIAANLPTDQLRIQVGRQQLVTAGSFTVMFGPSRAVWIAMAARLGPGFAAFVSRSVPALAPEVASGATAASGVGFSSWLGVIGIAVPIGIAVRDFTNAICAWARTRGVQRGHFNHVGVGYVYHVYAMRPRHGASPQASAAGHAKAQQDVARYGLASVRRYLEQHFREGRPMPERQSQAGSFDDREVHQVGFELGERMFQLTQS